jgi:molybdopterin-binding protein
MNTIQGVIQSITEDDLFVKIDIVHTNDRFSSCVLHADHRIAIYKEGMLVDMIFKEADTFIVLGINKIVSCHNRFVSKVSSVTFGTIMTRIAAIYDKNPIISLVTTASAQSMDIRPGSEIVCMVKSTSMMLAISEFGRS